MNQALDETILAVILGASSFPRWPQLGSNNAFSNSAREFERYLRDGAGLGLPDHSVLSLFDSKASVADQDDAIASFVTSRMAALRLARKDLKDIIVYYVGHGGFFSPHDQYFLALKGTQESKPSISGYPIRLLATTLKESAPFVRRYLILDCCFSAAAYEAFQSAPLEVVRRKTQEVLPPGRGTALLCAAGSRDPAKALPGDQYTMFSGALLQVLLEGVNGLPERLSLSDVGQRVDEMVRERFADLAVRPQIGCPDQSDGNVATFPLFPNRARAHEESPALPAAGPASSQPNRMERHTAEPRLESSGEFSGGQRTRTPGWLNEIDFLRASDRGRRRRVFIGLLMLLGVLPFALAGIATHEDTKKLPLMLSVLGVATTRGWIGPFVLPDAPAANELTVYMLMFCLQGTGCWLVSSRGGTSEAPENSVWIRPIRAFGTIGSIAGVSSLFFLPWALMKWLDSHGFWLISFVAFWNCVDALLSVAVFLHVAQLARSMHARTLGRWLTIMGPAQACACFVPLSETIFRRSTLGAISIGLFGLISSIGIGAIAAFLLKMSSIAKRIDRV